MWDARLPLIGQHPVAIVTINPLLSRLSSVTVVVITGTEGPHSTHVQLDPSSGLTEYDTSYANVTDVQTIAQSRLRSRRGRLHAAELARIEEAIRVTLGL